MENAAKASQVDSFSIADLYDRSSMLLTYNAGGLRVGCLMNLLEGDIEHITLSKNATGEQRCSMLIIIKHDKGTLLIFFLFFIFYFFICSLFFRSIPILPSQDTITTEMGTLENRLSLGPIYLWENQTPSRTTPHQQ
jgi:hypothetical protein